MASPQPRATLDDVRAILLSFSLLFERKRLLGPRQVLMTLMVMIHGDCGYRRGLSQVSEMMGVEFGWEKVPPRAGSFTKARYKLTPAKMLEMYQTALQSTSAIAARNRWLWRGYRLVAADGSRFLLSAADALIDAYMRPLVTNGEAYQPQLLQVTLWDVGACQPISWRQRPCRGKGNGERAILLEQLDQLGPKDLVLLDRGYPSRRIIFELIAREITFVIRMTAGKRCDFAEVAAFMAVDAEDATMNFTYNDSDSTEILEEQLRLVRDVDEDGSGCVLVTNLMDDAVFTSDDILQVYRRRWGIETAFKDMKMRYEIEGFHGTTPQLVEQEIIALMFLLLIESLVEEAALATLPKDDQGHGDQDRPQRCNRAALGDRIPNLLNLAVRSKRPTILWQAYIRGLHATAMDREQVRRPDRNRVRRCLSQYGRWRCCRPKYRDENAA